MTSPPPQPRIPPPAPITGYQNRPGGYGPAQPSVPAQRQLSAPTLMQFWRSDTRVVPGRKPAKWAGRAAFWLGLAAAVLYLGEFFFVGVPGILVAIAAPLGLVAVIFALIAIIAGVGRGLGIFGLIFALVGSRLFWIWLESIFG